MTLKIGCIGTSAITKETIAAIRCISKLEAYAIYSRDIKKAQSFALPKAYDQLEGLLSDPDLDVIYIASPNSLHYTHAKAALEAGKHVVLEKPFTQTRKEAENLFSLAKERGCMLIEAITTIHSDNFKTIKSGLGELGPIHYCACNYSQYSARYTQFLEGDIPRIFNPSFGGGALGDLNIYNLHLIIGLFGTPLTQKYFPNRAYNGVDTSGLAVLSYPGFQAACFAAKDCDGDNELIIQGEKARIKAGADSRFPGQVESQIKSLNKLAIPLGRLENEWRCFAKAIQNEDWTLHEEWKAHSLAVLSVFEKLKEDL